MSVHRAMVSQSILGLDGRMTRRTSRMVADNTWLGPNDNWDLRPWIQRPLAPESEEELFDGFGSTFSALRLLADRPCDFSTEPFHFFTLY